MSPKTPTHKHHGAAGAVRIDPTQPSRETDLHHTQPIRRTFRRATLAAVAGATFVATGVPLPMPASASPVMSYGAITIDAVAQAALLGSVTSDAMALPA